MSNMTYEELREETEKEIGELTFEQCLVLRCIYEGYFHCADPRENTSIKFEP